MKSRRRHPGSTAERKPFEAALLVIPGLLAITIAVFWPIQDHSFLKLDDEEYIYGNPHVSTGFSVRNVLWALHTTHAGNWHPLTWMSHMLDVEIYGLSPAGHHRTALLLHLANVLLLYFVLRRATGDVARSGFVAALFAVHPLHVESVAWAAERKDLLSALFLLLSVLAYLRWTETPRPARFGLMVLLYALGLMSKPMVVTAPILLVMLDWWPLSRCGAGRRTLPQLAAEKAPLFLLAAACGVVTFLVQHTEGAVVSVAGYPLGLRLENAVVSYARYIGKMFWPEGLAVPYPYPNELPAWQVAGAALLLAAITAAAIATARKAGYFLVGWGWFVIGLVPVIGVIQVGGQAMADRYTYVPLIGLFIVAAWGIPDAWNWATGRRDRISGAARRAAVTAAAASGAVLLALGAAARVQVGVWRNSITLHEHALKVTRGNYLAHNDLGVAYDEAGEPVRALEQFRRALEIAPDFALARNNLGRTLAGLGRLEEAVAEYRVALSLAPGQFRAYHNLGFALGRLGRTQEAIQAYRDALRLEPGSGESHFNLAVLLYATGDYAGARTEIDLARRCGYAPNPEFVKALSEK